MPGITTHHYILFKALCDFGDDGSPAMKAIQASNLAAWENAKHSEERTIDVVPLRTAGCAYLGSCGPDLFYLDLGKTGTFIADLLHYNRSGLYMIWWLEKLKRQKSALMDNEIGRKARMEYAFCLGHIAHIAADIIIHPYVNSIVQAYPLNKKQFENSRGWNAMNLWKFHNILEQHQDAYILYHKFFSELRFADGSWENINIAKHAADYFLYKNKSAIPFVTNPRLFYRYKKRYSLDLAKDKFKFFKSDNFFLNLSTYYDVTIPDKATLEEHLDLLQPRVFEEYLQRAIAQTIVFFKEAEMYLLDATEKKDDPRLEHAKTFFPELRRHWNLDCGLAPGGGNENPSWAIPTRADTRMCIAGELAFGPPLEAAESDDVEFPLKK